MKKLGIILTVCLGVFLLAGCEKVATGNYKTGTYYGSAVDNYGGEENTALAVIYVGNNGKIESVYVDTTYKTATGGKTTKKALGKDYNMQTYNPNASGEWYEQMEKLEAKIVEKQGIDFLALDSEGKTDAVSGVTIKINAIYQALQNALTKAK